MSLSRRAIYSSLSEPDPTLERTRASRFGRAEFVSRLRLARVAHGDRWAAIPPPMKDGKSAAIERIRLFFPLPSEERIAVALTEFWESRAGPRIADLRPDMTLGEVLDLAQDHLWTTTEFAHMLELVGIESFDDQFEQMTLRDFVRYAASRNPHHAQPVEAPNERP